MDIKRILLTADFTRQPHLKIKDGDVKRNVTWFSSLVGDLLSAVTTLPVSLNFYNMEDFKTKLYNFCGFKVPFKQSDWHKIFYNNANNEDIKSLFYEYYKESLVVGVELPVIFCNYFEALNIPYINLIVHPIRYMDDLLMGIKTNCEQIYNKLKSYQVNPDIFSLHATYLKTALRIRAINNPINPNSCIIFGQTSEDISILKSDNSLVTLMDYKDKLTEYKNNYEHVYFKPHPYNLNNDKAIVFLSSIFNKFSVINNMSAYEIYANENVDLCVALSSGSLYEAKYFGKTIEYLYKPPFLYGENYIGKAQNEFDFKDIHITVYKEYLTYHFWSEILSDVIETIPKQKLDSLSTNNIFRYALGATWSYNDNKSEVIENNLQQIKLNIETINSKKNKTLSFRIKKLFTK